MHVPEPLHGCVAATRREVRPTRTRGLAEAVAALWPAADLMSVVRHPVSLSDARGGRFSARPRTLPVVDLSGFQRLPLQVQLRSQVTPRVKRLRGEIFEFMRGFPARAECGGHISLNLDMNRDPAVPEILVILTDFWWI